MPTYDYQCPKCGTEFEVFQRMKDKPGAPCPKCGAKAKRQLSGGHGLVFKGSGFYITDYKRKGEKSKASDSGSTSGGASDKGSSTTPKASGD